MSQIQPVALGDRLVGPGRDVFVIAEIGVNHNGDMALAERLVDAAADAGADAVKFQTFTASDLVAGDAPKAQYQRERTSGNDSQLEMLRALELDAGDHARLAERCRARSLVFLSTPFDKSSIDLLVGLGLPALKIASPDLTNPLLLEQAAATGLPLLLSTGLATLAEVEEGVRAARAAGAAGVVVLHCESAYPAPAAEANLLAIPAMAEYLGVPVGYSDHTLGLDASAAAVALGACVIEKHLTLDRAFAGPDHAASSEPDEFAALVRSIRTVESALGDGIKRAMPAEEANRAAIKRSLAAARDLEAGTVLAAEMLIALRPGTGVPPSRLGDVVGRTLVRSLGRGELVDPSLLA
jgi:N-acetylneuraminate synthase